MKGGSLGPVLLAGLGPVIFLFLIFLALFSGAGGWILWRPTVLWTDQTYLAGSASQNTTLLKYDLNDTRLWSKDTLPLIEGKIAATADNVYYAGIFGNLDLVQKYDANGYRLWTSNFSNASYGRVVGMQADSSELFILTETSLLKYSLDCSRLWSHPFGTAGP